MTADIFSNLSRDAWLMLIGGAVLCTVGATIIGLMVGAAYSRRDSKPQATQRRTVRTAAPTAVYSPDQWRELWRQVDDETHILRRVDPTELPKRPRVHSGRRWLR